MRVSLIGIRNARQLVWMPVFGLQSVAAALDPVFATACKAYPLDEQSARKIASHAWQHMGNKGPVTPSHFFHFDGDLLLRGVYYKPGDGVWLTLGMPSIASIDRPLVYHGHNEDLHPLDRLWLLHAFGEWASIASTLLEWK